MLLPTIQSYSLNLHFQWVNLINQFDITQENEVEFPKISPSYQSAYEYEWYAYEKSVEFNCQENCFASWQIRVISSTYHRIVDQQHKWERIDRIRRSPTGIIIHFSYHVKQYPIKVKP